MHAKHAHVQIWIGFHRTIALTRWPTKYIRYFIICEHGRFCNYTIIDNDNDMYDSWILIYYQDLLLFFPSPKTPTYAIQLKMNGLFITINYWFRLNLAVNFIEPFKLKTFFPIKKIYLCAHTFRIYRQIH